MDIITQTHALFGERVLPLLIVVAAIWFTVTWSPNQGRTLPGRIFIWLVALQFVLGLIQWVYGLFLGRQDYLSFPFILHPFLGLLAILLAPFAVYPRERGPLRSLGRWGPLLLLTVLLLIVAGSITTGLARG